MIEDVHRRYRCATGGLLPAFIHRQSANHPLLERFVQWYHDDEHFIVTDFWGLHRGCLLAQGMYQVDGVDYGVTRLLNEVSVQPWELPLHVETWKSHSGRSIWDRPLQRGLSPLRWAIANHAGMENFWTLCNTKISSLDWKLAGLPIDVNVGHTRMNLLRLMHLQAFNPAHFVKEQPCRIELPSTTRRTQRK